MAEGTRLQSMEESIRKTESQLLELQQFMNSNKEFMNSTKNFIEESRAQHEEHRLAIAEQGKKTESQFTQITEMFRSLMEKGTPLPANPSTQSTEGIFAPNPAAAPRSTMRHSPMGQNLPKPAKSEVNSGPGANVQHREILELPSTGIRAQRGLFPRILMEENTKVVSNLDEDPKELKKIIDGIVETEAMHQVMFFDPPPEAKFSGSTDKLQTNLTQEIMNNSSFGMEFNPGNPTIDASPKESKVVLNSSLEKLAFEIESEELGNLVDKSMASIEITWNDIKNNSLGMDMLIAYKVFDVLPMREIDALVDHCGSIESFGSFFFYPGKNNEFPICTGWVEILLTLVFDPGGILTAVLHCVYCWICGSVIKKLLVTGFVYCCSMSCLLVCIQWMSAYGELF